MSAWPLLASAVQVLGWTLVHFVWQAAAIGAAYALVRVCLPRGEPRYLLGMLALVALALCPVLTAWRLLAGMSAVAVSGSAWVVAGSTAAPVQAAAQYVSPAWQALLSASLPWLVLAWLGGVALLSARVWHHWRKLKILVRMAETLPALHERAQALARRFGLRRKVRVLSSARVATPTLVGWIRPVILLPVAVTWGFPAEQVELILAHELAHLRRFDHLANLFQVMLETLLFYHPVVHWISRDVRNEREICCDALALRVSGGNRRDFVAALVELEEYRESHAGLALAASGGVLLERVWQITGSVRGAGLAKPPARFVGVMFGSLLAALVLSVLWRQAEIRRQFEDSLSKVENLVVPQVLSASFREPVFAIRNLVPARMVLPQQHLRVTATPRAPDAQSPAMIVAPESAPPAAFVATLPKVADLVPAHVALEPSRIPVQPAAPTAIEAPTPTHIERPVYPRGALEQGIEGQVVVEFGLNADGSVDAPMVVSAQPQGLFDHAAVHALLGSKFAVPDGAGGRRYRQTFSFTLHPSTAATTGEQIQARAGCYVVTGTNICRSNADALGAYTNMLH